MPGLSTRKYGQAVREFTDAYGLEKSAVSEHFIEASRTKLKELMERPLGKRKFCALMIDATPFEGQQMVAALAIGCDGAKTILGIRQGATENATVVGELLSDLMNRGLDFTEPRLYVLDGGKALHAAVRKHAGEQRRSSAARCKRRNVLDHLADDQTENITKKLNAAYAIEEYEPAKQALDALHRELMHLNPSASRSLAEGLEETLTVHRLHVHPQLRMTLSNTNFIESAFAIVERVCFNLETRSQGCCQSKEGLVKWFTREPLLSTKSRAFPGVADRTYNNRFTDWRPDDLRHPKTAGWIYDAGFQHVFGVRPN